MKTKLLALILAFCVAACALCSCNAGTTQASSTTRSTGPTITAAPVPPLGDCIFEPSYLEADNIADFANKVKNAEKSNEFAEILREIGKIYSFSLISDEYKISRIWCDGFIEYSVYFNFEAIVENPTYGKTFSLTTYYRNWFDGSEVEIEDFEDFIYYDIIYQETLPDGSIYVETEKSAELFFYYDGYVHSISLNKFYLDDGFEGELNWQDIVKIETINFAESEN